MNHITMRNFMVTQPSFPEGSETDSWYLSVANRLLRETEELPFCRLMPESLARRVALALTDYLQDVVSDAGLWRSFVDANRELYGFSVPFHKEPDDYVDYELNRIDARFLVWYVSAMLWEEMRSLYPHDHALTEYADACFDILDSVYEEAPVAEQFNIANGLEFKDAGDHKAIYELGNWLFLHSYLLTPAFSMTLRDIIANVDNTDDDSQKIINDRLEQAMMDTPTGPLALFTPEWVYLMIERHLPNEPKAPESAELHPYYKAFTSFTGGKEIMFFDSYESMNRFFIEALGWESGVEHLTQAKGAHDYVLMVTPHKGMLMARDVARCIKAPDNHLYNEEYAVKHSFELFTVRGVCPGDLLRRCIENKWLPDACFPGTEDHETVERNADFIARCYLQLYYRD